MTMNFGKTMLAAGAPLPQWVYFLAIFAVIVLSAVAVFLWAVLFRKKKRKRKHRSRHHHGERQLNPTLAEGGGLPPARDGKNSDAPTP